jgi:ketosteroid isomerase-like protein
MVMALLAMLMIGSSSFAQTTGPLTQGSAQDDREQLHQLRAIYERAVAEDKVELLEPYIDRQFTGVMVTGESVSGFNDLKAYWEKIKSILGPGGHYRITLEPAPTEFFGELALSHGGTREHVLTDAGKTYDFASQWTAVSRKQDGQWKLLRVQAALDPVNNVFVKSFLTRTAWISGSAGGAIGLVLGILVMFLLRRRKRDGKIPA